MPGGTPYHGTPLAIPGTIEAEDFDLGGEGVAYHDDTVGNSGGVYRTSEDVDIWQETDGTVYVGANATGEWREYTVSVASDGNYDATLVVSTPNDGVTVHLEVDGTDITGPVTLPNTGAWVTWTNVTVPVTLTAGQHVLRFAVDVGGFNIDKIIFSEQKVSDPSISPNGGVITTQTQITISTTTQGASIYYTLDGSVPTTNSILYTGPFTLNADTTVRAFAVKQGLPDSNVVSATFVVSGSGATLTVNPAGGADYTTIAAAVAAANPGDTVLLQDGDYPVGEIITGNGAEGQFIYIRPELGASIRYTFPVGTADFMLWLKDSSWIDWDWTGVVITDGNGTATKPDFLYVTNSSVIRLSNYKQTGKWATHPYPPPTTYRGEFSFDGACADIIVRDFDVDGIDHAGGGIKLDQNVHTFQLVNCRISNVSANALILNRYGVSTKISRKVLVRNSILGPSFISDGIQSGAYDPDNQTDIVVWKTLFPGVTGENALDMKSGSRVLVYHCLMHSWGNSNDGSDPNVPPTHYGGGIAHRGDKGTTNYGIQYGLFSCVGVNNGGGWSGHYEDVDTWLINNTFLWNTRQILEKTPSTITITNDYQPKDGEKFGLVVADVDGLVCLNNIFGQQNSLAKLYVLGDWGTRPASWTFDGNLYYTPSWSSTIRTYRQSDGTVVDHSTIGTLQTELQAIGVPSSKADPNSTFGDPQFLNWPDDPLAAGLNETTDYTQYDYTPQNTAGVTAQPVTSVKSNNNGAAEIDLGADGWFCIPQNWWPDTPGWDKTSPDWPRTHLWANGVDFYIGDEIGPGKYTTTDQYGNTKPITVSAGDSVWFADADGNPVQRPGAWDWYGREQTTQPPPPLSGITVGDLTYTGSTRLNNDLPNQNIGQTVYYDTTYGLLLQYKTILWTDNNKPQFGNIRAVCWLPDETAYESDTIVSVSNLTTTPTEYAFDFNVPLTAEYFTVGLYGDWSTGPYVLVGINDNAFADGVLRHRAYNSTWIDEPSNDLAFTVQLAPGSFPAASAKLLYKTAPEILLATGLDLIAKSAALLIQGSSPISTGVSISEQPADTPIIDARVQIALDRIKGFANAMEITLPVNTLSSLIGRLYFANVAKLYANGIEIQWPFGTIEEGRVVVIRNDLGTVYDQNGLELRMTAGVVHPLYITPNTRMTQMTNGAYPFVFTGTGFILVQ